MKRIAVATAVMLVFLCAAGASAHQSGAETITTTLYFPSFPSGPPNVGVYSGTFSASGTVSDSGTVSAQALFSAVPSPVTGVLHTVRTLTGANGTLTLRCNQHVQPGQTTTVVTNTGSCVVQGATGAYAGLKGSGSLTGTTDFGATPVTIQDTLTL